ncbi:MAG: hypothetical protein FWF46_03685 [Oscillospiraceae bacterium]|nr:hypothetical protein [Oscillospiraceae bacterium]
MSKNQIFFKMTGRNYNNILEKVLEKKDFTANAKSLLLSMFYKIENSYDDYKTVKILVKDKEQFIEETINIINYQCNKIILVEPNSDKGKELKEQGRSAVVEDGIMFAHPTENALFAGVAEMVTKNYNIKSEYNFVKQQLKKVLELGYIHNTKEIIYDFDGWSWNAGLVSQDETLYNLIFFNALVLLGIEFMEEWRISDDTTQNFIDKAEIRLAHYYGKKNKIISMNAMFDILVKILIKDSMKEFVELLAKGKDTKKSLDYIENRLKYLEDIYKEKRRINKKIKDIDNIILDKELLDSEYKKRNSKLPLNNQIFSKKHLFELLKREREKLFEQLKNYNVKLEPQNYIKEKNEIIKEYKKIKHLEKIHNNDLSLKAQIINFQKIFLSNLQKKTIKTDNKKAIIDLIFLFRYYKYIKIDENEYIKDIPEIQKHIKKTERLILRKAYEYSVFVRITQDLEKSIDILVRILDTKIIDLHEIKLVSKVMHKKLLLEIYDGEVLDTTLEIADNVKSGANNKGKKINLFL